MWGAVLRSPRCYSRTSCERTLTVLHLLALSCHFSWKKGPSSWQRVLPRAWKFRWPRATMYLDNFDDTFIWVFSLALLLSVRFTVTQYQRRYPNSFGDIKGAHSNDHISRDTPLAKIYVTLFACGTGSDSWPRKKNHVFRNLKRYAPVHFCRTLFSACQNAGLDWGYPSWFQQL